MQPDDRDARITRIFVYTTLTEHKACEFGELYARLYKTKYPGLTFTRKLVYDACLQLEEQRKIDKMQVQIQCSFPPSHPPLFLFSTRIDPEERQQAIEAKAQLLAQHYDNTKVIGAHAELLVKNVCENLDYKRISIDKSVGNHDIDVYAKHPSDTYWQAISVKNWRDSIRISEVTEIVEIVKLAHAKYKRKIIQPAITAPKAYPDAITNQYHVPVATYEKQVAPESCRQLYEALNDKLAFDVEITDKPTAKMRENIEEYICKHDYESNQQPAG
jgi:hypothetical protein